MSLTPCRGGCRHGGGAEPSWPETWQTVVEAINGVQRSSNSMHASARHHVQASGGGTLLLKWDACSQPDIAPSRSIVASTAALYNTETP